MKRRLTILSIVLVCAAMARAGDTPFDVLHRAYSPYMAADDPLAFPLKIMSISSDEYKFWRGTKDLFFRWCKTQCADWMMDQPAFLPNHGDLHLGNIGSYASEDGWGKLAFGMVDFDDSARLPFQVELLQGLITLELVVQQNHIQLSERQKQQLLETLFESYRHSVNSQRNATALLMDAKNPIVAKLMNRRDRQYSSELDDYVENGRFRPTILNNKGMLKEILRPATHRADELAGGITQSLANSEEMRGLFRSTDTPSIRKAIKDIVQRARLGSSGSQGLKKYFVLMSKPLKDVDQDVILYLKQEIPSAAERSGVIPMESISPGRRLKQHMDRLTEPRPYLNSWCDIGTESYWVTLKEPWSDEVDFEALHTPESILEAARIWGTVAGATHREDGRFELILPRLTPALLAEIRQRCDTFLKQLANDFEAYTNDARTGQLVSRAEAEVAHLTKR